MLSFNFYAAVYYTFDIIQQVCSFNIIKDTKIKFIHVDTDKSMVTKIQVPVLRCVLLRGPRDMDPNFAVQVSFVFTERELHTECLNHKIITALQDYCKGLFFVS